MHRLLAKDLDQLKVDFMVGFGLLFPDCGWCSSIFPRALAVGVVYFGVPRALAASRWCSIPGFGGGKASEKRVGDEVDPSLSFSRFARVHRTFGAHAVDWQV